jgi:hypothetical protein
MTGSVQWLNLVIEAIRNVLAANTPIFDSTGASMAVSAATILLALFGYEYATGGVDGDFFARLWRAVMMICIVFACVFYYDRPLPLLGMTFPQIVTRQCEAMARTIGVASAETIIKRSAQLWGSMEVPGALDYLGWFNWIVIALLVNAINAVSFGAVAVGLILEATMKLFGPVFLPFFLVPRFDWLAWNWLKAFMGFAFFEVFAAALLRISVQVMVPALDAIPSPMSLGDQAAAVAVLFVLLASLTYTLLKIPTWVGMLFSGSVGGGGLTSGWWR